MDEKKAMELREKARSLANKRLDRKMTKTEQEEFDKIYDEADRIEIPALQNVLNGELHGVTWTPTDVKIPALDKISVYEIPAHTD